MCKYCEENESLEAPCSYWFPYAVYIEHIKIPDLYLLTKQKCLAYLIYELHDLHIMIWVVVMDTVERNEIRGLAAQAG